MAATDKMRDLVVPILAEHPWRHRITLVPERPGEVTTEGGLDVVTHHQSLVEIIQHIQAHRVHVSLFIDPEATKSLHPRYKGVDMIGAQHCTLL